MAKTAKKTERDLSDRLHALGLRKSTAKNIAHATANMKGPIPESARGVLKDMIAKVDDLGPGAKKRKRAEEKAAANADGPKKVKKKAKKKAKKAKKKAKKAAKNAKKAVDGA